MYDMYVVICRAGRFGGGGVWGGSGVERGRGAAGGGGGLEAYNTVEHSKEVYV